MKKELFPLSSLEPGTSSPDMLKDSPHLWEKKKICQVEADLGFSKEAILHLGENTTL